MSSPRSINNDNAEQQPLLASGEDVVSCATRTLVGMQFAFELIDTVTRTGYTSTTLITDMLNLPKHGFGINYCALGVSIPLAILFAYAEARSHCSQSAHFIRAQTDHAHHDIEQGAPVKTPPASLTWSQSIFSSLHFVSDIYEGMAMPMALSKLIPTIATLPALGKTALYTGLGVFSFFGNLQEYLNTRVAFKEENMANHRHPLPS